MDSEEEHRILEESLNKALEEAWTKTTAALEQVAKAAEEREKAVWFAAESVEYASLLFSLTNDLEDVDPPPPSNQPTETLPLVKESVFALQRVRSSESKDKVEDYKKLRIAVHNLRSAYLSFAKKPGRRGRT